MVFQLKAVAYGFGALLLLGGILLMALGYNAKPNNTSEIGEGQLLVVVAIVIWALGFISKESKKGGLFHR